MVGEKLKRHGGDRRAQDLWHTRHRQDGLRDPRVGSVTLVGYRDDAGAACDRLLDVGEGHLAEPSPRPRWRRGTARRRGLWGRASPHRPGILHAMLRPSVKQL